jgi:hypothetical protein
MVYRRITRAARSGGNALTFITVIGLLAVLGLTVFGLGSANHALANFDASSWLWSSRKGELARVNGVTGRVDTRTKLAGSEGHPVQVSQSDRYVLLRDPGTGTVSVMDLSTLHIGATTATTAGIGVTVAMHNDVAVVVDPVQGMISQLDPATLLPVGEPLHFPAGLSGGTFDSTGLLWLLVPSEGTVVAVRPATSEANGTPRQGGGATVRTGQLPAPAGRAAAPRGPAVARTVGIADRSHDLALTVLDQGVAVLDKTATTLTTVPREGAARSVPLPLTGPGAMPARTSGSQVAVTVVDQRHVYVVAGDRVAEFTVPGATPKLQPCTAWAGRFYCPDRATGTVYELDPAGRATNTIALPAADTPLELEVREDHLFINAPDTATARVIDDHHRVTVVDKYANDVVGGDPPPAPPPPPPAVGVPDAPAGVTATAGNASARVNWSPAPANGAAITRYVVEGDGKAHEVGADQRSLALSGLTNGQRYTFTVRAVNARGSGAKRAANPVVPTAEVPDPPASITATEHPDGTVSLRWPAANGQGRRVIRYEVTAITAGGQGQPVSSDATGATLRGGAAGPLQFGTQYAFTVVAVNDRGASSRPSPVSNTVVPYSAPSAPAKLRAAAVATQAGAVSVSWEPAGGNGRPVTGYVVTANGASTNVSGTSATLTGFGEGVRVQLSVHAVNAAGPGADATGTASTISKPKLTVSTTSGTLSSITVNVAVADGGSPTSCTLTLSSGGRAAGNCSSLTVAVHRAGTPYSYTVTATNWAGSVTASGSASTGSLRGRVRCVAPDAEVPCYDGVGIYSRPWQDTSSFTDANGVTGQSFDAYCWTPGAKGNQQPSATLKAAHHNNNKVSDKWVRINPTGRYPDRYIPFIWFNLDNGDNVSALPQC